MHESGTEARHTMQEFKQDHNRSGEQIQADNGVRYPASIYEESSKAVGSQQWVANEWAKGKLPAHNTGRNQCTLRSGTRNFKGNQYPDGSGRLKHYSTLEAIRTLNQVVISNTECFARGWAHCSVPHTDVCPNGKYALPLSTMASSLPQSTSTIVDVQLGEKVNGSYERLSDGDYDRLVVTKMLGTDDFTHYRASRDGFDSDPLSERDVDAFLDAIMEDAPTV